jgi:hypothetical protein
MTWDEFLYARIILTLYTKEPDILYAIFVFIFCKKNVKVLFAWGFENNKKLLTAWRLNCRGDPLL